MKIITFNGSYIPGFKAGGPIRSIENMAYYLKEEITFHIFTNDRDNGDKIPYEKIIQDEWNKIGNEEVYYKSPNQNLIKAMSNELNTSDYDCVLLNGFFSEYTIRYLILNKFKKIPKRKIFLMPRGDFSEGALSLKKSKKALYTLFLSILKLDKNVQYLATSEEELNQIKKIRKYNEMYLVSNFPSKDLDTVTPNKVDKKVNELSLIYISRITPVKNLKFALNLFFDIKKNVSLDIYGPIYDYKYYKECLDIIKTLPSNIKVNYYGEINHKWISYIIRKYHAMILPTLGENYGHIIVESLINSTPVIISDNTPWNKINNYKAGWTIPLNSHKEYIKIIDDLIELNNIDYNIYRENANEFIRNNHDVSSIKNMYLKIFLNNKGEKENEYTK